MLLLQKGQGQRIDQGRANIKEMAVQQTGQQQRQHRQANAEIFRCGSLPKQPDGLDPVDAVGRQTHNTAGRQNLQRRIVPACGEKGIKGIHSHECVLVFILVGIEASAENRVIQELLYCAAVHLYPAVGLRSPGDHIPK